VIAEEHIDTLEPEQLRAAVRALMTEVRSKSREVAFKQATIDKLTHEMAVLKRLKFAAKSEAYNAEQKSLLEETIDADLAALAAEIESHQSAKPVSEEKQQPKREKLPAHLPRREILHEPEDTTCGCGQAMKRIGEDVSEKLDYPYRPSGHKQVTTARGAALSGQDRGRRLSVRQRLDVREAVARGCRVPATASPERQPQWLLGS
jgi:hypothetical protein